MDNTRPHHTRTVGGTNTFDDNQWHDVLIKRQINQVILIINIIHTNGTQENYGCYALFWCYWERIKKTTVIILEKLIFYD